jgi:hypothetical protein
MLTRAGRLVHGDREQSDLHRICGAAASPPRLAIAAVAAEDRITTARKEEGPVRWVVLAAAMAILSACAAESATPPKDSAASAETLKRDCADPHWKEQNLGLWYSVCRTPMRW